MAVGGPGGILRGMMIFKGRIFLGLGIAVAFCACAIFLSYRTPHFRPEVSSHQYTLSAFYSTTEDVVLFFESSEDSVLELLKTIENNTTDYSFVSCVLLLAAIFYSSALVKDRSSTRRVSLDSLWQKTTTSL